METQRTQNPVEEARQLAGTTWNHFVDALTHDKPAEVRYQLLRQWRSAYARSHALSSIARAN